MPSLHDQSDAFLMRRAIRLAMNGRGRVEPNPMVGCVIARGGQILGEGYHQQFGGPHAEPNALAACAAAGHSPAGATVYVTLEPCCHTNKKTPPCAPRLIEAGVARVVVGCVDPNPQVSSRGLATLREAGIETAGPETLDPWLEAQAKQLIAPFIARFSHRRPYVTLKWAVSRDGKVAGPGGLRVQIGNAASSRAVHQLRAACDAILIGSNTASRDDPLLTVRGVEVVRPLRRIVLATDGIVSRESQLVRTAREHPLVVFCRGIGEGGLKARLRHSNHLGMAGVDFREIPTDASGRLSLSHLLTGLETDVTHLLVEPGPTLAGSFLRENLADRVWIFRSPKTIGDATAPSAVGLPADYVASGQVNLKGDKLTEYLNHGSDVFFGDFPSADLARVGGVLG